MSKTVKQVQEEMKELKNTLIHKHWGKEVPKSESEEDLLKWQMLEEELKLAASGWKHAFPALVNRRTGKPANANLRYTRDGKYWVVKTVAGSEWHKAMSGKNTSLYNAGYEVRNVSKNAVVIRTTNDEGKSCVKVVAS